MVIIGAGFAGLSSARRLLQLDPKLNVVVLVDFLSTEESAMALLLHCRLVARAVLVAIVLKPV